MLNVSAVQPFASVITGISDDSLNQPTSLCVSGVDDSESECGLDGGLEFDWIINNDADGPFLEEQLQPLLKLALEAADPH